MRVPDHFEALTGYRAWQVRDNGLLCGRHQAEPWPVKQPMVARCSAGNRAHLSNHGAWKPSPVRGCSCGVHAYKTLEQAKAEQSRGWSWVSDPIVFGAVKVWGRVLEHERGYRAEFGYPSEIVVDDERLVSKVAVYGVSVRYEPKPESQPEAVDVAGTWANIVRSTSVWWTPRRLGVLTPVSDFAEPGPSLLWTPPDEERSPIHTPHDARREQRHIALWKSIAHMEARR